MHLQLIVSVSRLLGDITNLNSARFQDSLSVINNYAAADKAMQHTIFPNQVKDLTKKVKHNICSFMEEVMLYIYIYI